MINLSKQKLIDALTPTIQNENADMAIRVVSALAIVFWLELKSDKGSLEIAEKFLEGIAGTEE